MKEKGVNQSALDEDLFKASARGDNGAIKDLLNAGADVNARNRERKTPIIAAVLSGKNKTISLLIKNNAKVNIKDPFGYTPLFWASCYGQLDVVELLLKNKALVDIQNDKGDTPLMQVCSSGKEPQVDIAKQLIKHGADVNRQNTSGITALMNTAMAGLLEFAQLLIEKEADVNLLDDRKMSALSYSCGASQRRANSALTKLLIQNGADIQVTAREKLSLLHVASIEGNADTLRVLLDEGLDLNENHGLPLRVASNYGHLACIRILIELGADVNQSNDDGQTALMLALSKRHYETGKALLEAGADVTAVTSKKSWEGDKSVLMYALGVEDGFNYERSKPPEFDYAVLQRLIDKGADVNFTSHSGFSCLKLAEYKKNRKLTKFLKENGAS